MLYFSDHLLVAMAPNVTQEGHKPPVVAITNGPYPHRHPLLAVLASWIARWTELELIHWFVLEHMTKRSKYIF